MVMTREIKEEIKRSMARRGISECTVALKFQGKYNAITIEEMLEKEFLGEIILISKICL